ncbi:MAG TPA: GRP family sugar transporter [Bryobacteraceae bacterium]|jgi:glucose uptake protein|nr:GRP family sugar transporter [Bryobacteraceae bacterium]
MILPGSHTMALIVLILGMLAWGLWANTFKAGGGGFRFELYYFDFAIGLLVASLVLALTAGSLGFDGFSFGDDLRLAGKRQDFFGFVAGVTFNLGNMLLVAAVSLAGMSVAFPLSMGVGLVVAVLWKYATSPGGNAAFLFGGVALVLVAIVFDVLAYSAWTTAKAKAAAEAGKKMKKPRLRGVLLGAAGGLLLGSFSNIIDIGQAGENGLGPYSIGVMFAVGVLFSTFVFNLFFMNLPVVGEPVEIGEYFRASISRHALGWLGGAIWYVGLNTSLINARIEGAAKVPAQISFGLAQASIVIAVLCGLFLWREMDAGDGVKSRVWVMLALLAAGIGLSAAGLASPK